MPFHCLDKDGQQRLQPLPTDPVRRFPQQYERIAFRFIINPRLRIPMKPATDSDLKPASHSDFIPASVPI